MFDPRLRAKILKLVDVSHGGENGFNQAIELSSEFLSGVKLIEEKRLLSKYFEEIRQDSGKYVCGVDDTLKALEMGVIEIIIVWEDIDIQRYVLKNSTTSEVYIKYMNKDQEADESNFRQLEVEEKMSLLECLPMNIKGLVVCSLSLLPINHKRGLSFARGLVELEAYYATSLIFDHLTKTEEFTKFFQFRCRGHGGFPAPD